MKLKNTFKISIATSLKWKYCWWPTQSRKIWKSHTSFTWQSGRNCNVYQGISNSNNSSERVQFLFTPLFRRECDNYENGLYCTNNLHHSAIQSEVIIFILRMWQRGSLSEHNDSKSWRIDSKSWCHERQARFLLKRETSTRTAPRIRAFINLRNDRHAWTDRNSLTGIDRQWVQK